MKMQTNPIRTVLAVAAGTGIAVAAAWLMAAAPVLVFHESIKSGDLYYEIKAAAEWGYDDLGLSDRIMVTGTAPGETLLGGYQHDGAVRRADILGIVPLFKIPMAAVKVPATTARFRELQSDPDGVTATIFHELVHARQHETGALRSQGIELPADASFEDDNGKGRVAAAGLVFWGNDATYLKMQVENQAGGPAATAWWRTPPDFSMKMLQTFPIITIKYVITRGPAAAVTYEGRKADHRYRELPWEAEAYAVAAEMLARYEAARDE